MARARPRIARAILVIAAALALLDAGVAAHEGEKHEGGKGVWEGVEDPENDLDVVAASLAVGVALDDAPDGPLGFRHTSAERKVCLAAIQRVVGTNIFLSLKAPNCSASDELAVNVTVYEDVEG